MTNAPSNANLLQHKDKRLVRLPACSDKRGNLCVAEFGDGMLPFTPKRAFWIWGAPADGQRGQHAHRTTHELLVCLQGGVTVRLTDAEGTCEYHLNEPTVGLHIPPMCWCDICGFTPNTTILCLASERYKPEGYINDLEELMSLNR